jgi:hypothetical protein
VSKDNNILFAVLKVKNGARTEPVFVNVSGVQDSIPPGWESIPGLFKRFTNTGSSLFQHVLLLVNGMRSNSERSDFKREKRSTVGVYMIDL